MSRDGPIDWRLCSGPNGVDPYESPPYTLRRGILRIRPCGARVSRLVADASNTLRPRVLHVRPQTPASLAAEPCCYPIGELLAGLPLEMQCCGDVYRGLAGLLRPSSDPPQAVIVCLDGLGAAEFEFFSIVSKLRRDLRVYVYAAARSLSRIAKAVELGATGPVTREVLVELAGAPPVAMTLEAPARASERVTDKLVSPMIPPAVSQPPRIDEEGARKPARVPWLRYGDRPARVAPTRREPPSQPPDPKPQTSAPPLSYEPLLTEEELRALMSDDFAAVVEDGPPSDARPVSRASTVPNDWSEGDSHAQGAP